jgi:aryl-alcohol dehydrogenase-like predicted oxidoreductase
MLYRKLGNTGLDVSALGFGAMRLPMSEGHVKTNDAIEVIHTAFKLGVNLIDSAVGYCNEESQVVVGKALKGWRDSVIVSTKNHYRGDDLDEFKDFLFQSLDRLDVECIDIYRS